jgi:hypothetical protein
MENPLGDLPASISAYDSFTQYAYQLAEYRSRNPSLQQDSLGAFAGTHQAVYDQPKDSVCFGHPSRDFDEALLWKPDKRSPAATDTIDTVIPTWSWASHNGTLTFLTKHDEYIGSFLQYYICISKQKGLESLVPLRNWESWPNRPESIFHGGYVLPDMPRKTYRTIALEEGCDTSDLEDEGSGETTHSLPLDNHSMESRNLAMTPGRLLFKTQTAMFTVKNHSHLNNSDEVFFPYSYDTEAPTVLSIFNKHGRMSGFLTLDRENDISSRFGQDQDMPASELIALSIARSQEVDGYEEYVEYQVGHNINSNRDLPRIREMIQPPAPVTQIASGLYVGDRTQDVRYYDDKGLPIRTPLVNVMLISWHEGVARREGVGQVYLARWKDAEPQLKSIVLG